MIVIKYARVPTALMESEIPEIVPFSTTTNEDGEERQRTLREFVFSHRTWDMEDGTTIFRLACDQSGKGYRHERGTDENDLMDWNGFLSPYGYGEDTWIEHEQVMELTNGEV